MKVVLKQTPVDAMPFERDRWNELVEFTNGNAHTITIPRSINGVAKCRLKNTISGDMLLTEGYWVVKSPNGGLCFHPPAKFNAIYRPC